jgi:hypothetical protein
MSCTVCVHLERLRKGEEGFERNMRGVMLAQLTDATRCTAY